MCNLFGDPLPRDYASNPARQPELFDPSTQSGTGSAWIRAAEDWATWRGLTILEWSLDQQFRAANGAQIRDERLPGDWWIVEWIENRWQIRPARQFS